MGWWRENFLHLVDPDHEDDEPKRMVITIMQCPTAGCNGRRSSSQVLCKQCWNHVSAETRSTVWRLYRNAPRSRDHFDAIAQARKEAQDAFDAETRK